VKYRRMFTNSVVRTSQKCGEVEKSKKKKKKKKKNRKVTLLEEATFCTV